MAGADDDEYDPTAGGTVAGILWQHRLALLALLKCDRKGMVVRLEVDDDISVLDEGDRMVFAQQSKHHLGEAYLTTGGTELWSTLRSWLKVYREGKVSEITSLVLSATSRIAADSPLQLLVGGPPYEDGKLEDLLKALDAIAAGPERPGIKKAIAAWRKTSREEKLDVLRAARIEPGLPRLNETREQLEDAVQARGCFPDKRKRRATNLVVGWFENLVSERMTPKGCSVRAGELWDYVGSLHEGFAPDVLLALHGSDQHPNPSEEIAKNPVYLQQIELLDPDDDEDAIDAIHAVFAATNELNDWRNNSMTSLHEVQMFNTELEGKWSAIRRTELRLGKKEGGDVRDIGWAIYDKCMQMPCRIARTDSPIHVTKGSLHRLADDARIGWHPNYKDKLRSKE